MPGKISFVIRTCNSARTLPALLARVGGPQSEVICVDSGSTDGTLELIRQHGAILRQIPQEQFSYGRSLNIGFAAATQDWVVAVSSHCLPVQEDFAAHYLKALERVPDGVVAVAGEVVQNRRLVSVSDELLVANSLRAAAFPLYFNGNPNCAYRRTAWQSHPFDETLHYSEDRAWVVGALERGSQVAVSFAVPVWYRNPVRLWPAFKKGWTEGMQAKTLPTAWSPERFANERSLYRHFQKLATLLGRKAARFTPASK